MADEKKKEKRKEKTLPVIEGVQTYYPGTKIVTREYRVKSGLKF